MQKLIVLGAILACCGSLPGCLSAARRSSGVIGCSSDDIQITNESVGALGDHTWTASCQGRTYFCSMNTAEKGAANVSCKESATTTRMVSGAQPAAPAPTGGAGFVFGASAEEAARTCVEAGGQWQAGQPNASCSKPARGVGFDGKAFVSLCEGKVCRVQVVAQKPDQEAATLKRTFTRLTNMLREKYGEPERASLSVPSQCADDLAGCLHAKQVTLSALWSWPNQSRLGCTLAAAGEDLALILVYRRTGLDTAGTDGL